MSLDAIILIRSVGERTVGYCKFLLEKQVAPDLIHIVEESPFSEAVRKSFQLGIEHGKKWTLCIDADVFVREGAIEELIAFADTLDEKVFEIQGTFIDKFIPIRRTGAIHLYRTSLLPVGLQHIPPEGSTLRPEGTTLKEMAKAGYPHVLTDILVGIHDFEQYYADIYRKCYTHAHKHAFVLNSVERYWKKNEEEDWDYKIANLGCMAGKIYDGVVLIDKNFVFEEAAHVMKLKCIEEKKPLTSEDFDPHIVEKTLESFKIDQDIQNQIFPKERWSQTMAYKPKSFLRQKLSSAFIYTGLGLEKSGRIVKTWGQKI